MIDLDELEQLADDIAWSTFKYEARKFREAIQELRLAREVVEAVAHIGVDFGYGEYELPEEIIAKARRYCDQHTEGKDTLGGIGENNGD